MIIYFKVKWDEMKEMDCVDLTAGYPHPSLLLFHFSN